MTRPETCLRCRRPLRPAHTTVADYPGTVIHHHRGHCGGCYDRLMKGLPGPADPTRPRIRVYDVDVVAVDLATHGDRVRLNVGERYLAIHQLRSRGYSARTIASFLHISQRTVERHLTRPTAPQMLEDAA